MPFFIFHSFIFIMEVSLIYQEYKNILEWFPIKDYRENEILLKNQKKVKVFRVEPINLKLKSEEEQEHVFWQFQHLLKNDITSMQIIIQTDRMDLEKHFEAIEKNHQQDLEVLDMICDYHAFLRKLAKQKACISRKYYLILPGATSHETEEKVAEQVQVMGNAMEKLREEEMDEMLQRCFRKTTSIRKDAKWV